MTDSLIFKALQAKLSSSGLEWIKLESFSLSSKDQLINLELTLEGEPTTVKVEIRYSIGGDNTIVVRSVETNRKWMTEAIKLVMVKTGDRFPLPGGLKGKMIRMLL
ncbi:MAG TPA: hypothetical protein VG796_10515 [Verrucomicrobiales bacterium]|jgi:hypothetical protein|nr:hypothetical protein [Verrucomicrobiales bacterium]